MLPMVRDCTIHIPNKVLTNEEANVVLPKSEFTMLTSVRYCAIIGKLRREDDIATLGSELFVSPSIENS